MDRLWTPWRYDYITGTHPDGRKGVPRELDQWPGQDQHCVFCNLIRSVNWSAGSLASVQQAEHAEKAGHIIVRLEHTFICLNAFPYSSGHILIVPNRHTDSLVKLSPPELDELMSCARNMEAVLREVYRPHGINLGLNLGEAAGAGVAGHLHIHMLPRWYGDTNFMTVTAETRILPETLDVTWTRLRAAYLALDPKRDAPAPLP